jgi:hypothetical protein
MTRRISQAGTRCLRTFVLTAACAAITGTAVRAQEPLTNQERNAFDRLRSGSEKAGPDSKPILDKAAKYYVGKLNSSETQRAANNQGMSQLIDDLDKRLLVPQHNYPLGNLHYSKLKPEQKQFVDEFGKAMVEALTVPATQAGAPIVRINGARMVAEVCRSGYDGAAEICLKILAKPDESDAVKLYALQGLKNLFWIVPETLYPEKSVFQKDNSGNLTPLETRCIQALIDHIFRQPPADLPAGDVDGILYVRREAVRALALVRVQQLGKAGAKPALALLKVARGDGLNPPSAMPQGADVRCIGERVEAIIGFCNLIPPKDYDLNVDYAVYQVGRAIQDLAPLIQPFNSTGSTPWRVTAQRMREALETWNKRSSDMKLENVQLITNLIAAADRDILKPMEEAQASSPPNAAGFGQALQQMVPKSKSLFKSDPKSTIGAP